MVFPTTVNALELLDEPPPPLLGGGVLPPPPVGGGVLVVAGGTIVHFWFGPPLHRYCMSCVPFIVFAVWSRQSLLPLFIIWPFETVHCCAGSFLLHRYIFIGALYLFVAPQLSRQAPF